MAGVFETLPGVTGTATAVVNDPAGSAPPNIIQTDHAWNVEVEWEIDGPLAPALGGEWEVTVYAESLGGGEEKQIGDTKTVSLAAAPALPLPRQYATTVNIPTSAADAVKGLGEGRYRLVTAILYKNLGFPLEMAAFIEGPIVMIYEGQP
jgi:hypothetical protein